MVRITTNISVIKSNHIGNKFIIITSGPNENSQKAIISVNVLAANSQDGVFE